MPVGMGVAYEHRAEQGNTVNVFTDFDHPELKILHGNMKFDQNKSCRGKEDLELSFWAKVDLELGLGRKTRVNVAKSMFTMRSRLALMTVISLD